jgi:hypothetical protein
MAEDPDQWKRPIQKSADEQRGKPKPPPPPKK